MTIKVNRMPQEKKEKVLALLEEGKTFEDLATHEIFEDKEEAGKIVSNLVDMGLVKISGREFITIKNNLSKTQL